MKTIASFSSKLLALILALMASVSTFAYDFSDGLLCYNILTENTIAVTRQSEHIIMPCYEYLPEDLVIPSEVTLQGKRYTVVSIDQWAFYGCTMLKSVIIPTTVTTIGLSAFHDCENLADVYIPKSVTTVEGSAFSYTKWYDNLPDGEVYINNTLYRYKGTAPENTKIVVKDGTTRIAGFTFWNQSNIVSVELPQTLTVIEHSAFEECTQLNSVTIPYYVTFIGANAFAECTSLTEVVCLAPTPPIAGVYANPSAKSEMFMGVDVSNATLYVRAESVEAYKTADQWKEFDQILPIQPQTDEDYFPTLLGLQRTEVEYYTDGADTPHLMSFNEYTRYVIRGRNGLYLTNDRITFLREENNQVLLYSPGNGINEDIVLYDWTLEEGDTLQVGLYDEIERGKLFRVTDVYTVTLLDGKEYKKWTLACGIEYIEGIGAINGEGYGNYLCLQHTVHPATYLGSPLVCASRNGKLLYQMDDAEMERLSTECLCEVETSYKSQWCDTWNILVKTGSVHPPVEETYRYQLAKDTVIGDYTYTAVVSKAINDALDAPHYVAAVRFTDDRKVYIYYDNAEYLLYDFNVQEGDELEVFAGINNYTSEIKTYKCTVTGVEQYACVGCPAAITLEVHNHPNDFREFYRQTQWIEGVGDINGFLNGINHYVEMDGGGSEYLLCAYKGDELKYTGDLYEEYGCGDDAEQSPEDLFPTLWGLQQTICSGYYGEEGDEWASGLTGPSQEITMMDGKPYLQWGSWYLREENDKILVYSEIQKKDLVLYDFTLELGDTLTTLNLVTPEFLEYEGIVGIVDYPLSDYDYTYPIDTLVVTELSKETLLDGKEYTRWKFSDGTVYVEGIGSMSETFFHHIADHLPVPVSYLGSYLVCVSKSNKLLYQMDEAEMERLGVECLCEVETSYKDQWCDTWNIMSFDGMVFESSVETDQYKLAQDTIIGEYVYTALTRQPTSSGTNPTSYVAAVRFTEDKKVYIFYDNTEYLLYDFDVQVGDVLETFVGINHYGPWNTCYYAVTGIEEIPEDGTKKIHLEAYVIDDEAESFVIETTWIEGVGSTDGFVMSPLGLGGIVGNSNYKLLCAYKDNELEYTSTWYNEYGCQCNANEINDSFYPTLAGLQRTSFYEHGEDCSANYAQLMISNRTMRIGSNYYLRFDDTPYGTLFLREYHNRVFVYSFADQRDLILYDWNLQVGDSMTYRSIDNYSYPDSEYPVVVNYMARSHSDGTITKEPLGKIYVTNISTVTLLDGNEYKKWTFNNGMEYIQGLGCMDGNYFSLIIPEAVPTCYRADHLVCASKNGQLLYLMDDAEMERLGAKCLCNIRLNDNAKNGKIGGRPTPTQWNMLEVETKEMGDVTPTIVRAETFSYTLENDSIVANGKTFYHLARQSTKDTAITKSIVGSLHFGEDNRVYFYRDDAEYVLYDFTAEPGDTLQLFAGINNYPQHTTYTHVVTGKDTIDNGACRMMLEVVFPEENASVENAQKVWLAGLGSIDGIVHNAATQASASRVASRGNASSSETQSSVMLCAWREDSCLYTTNFPDYDTLGCVYNKDGETGVEDVTMPDTSDTQKFIRDGQLLIIHEGKTYNVMGIAVE